MDAFTQTGLTVYFVSPKGGKAPMVGIDLEDRLNKAFLEDSEQVARGENTLNPAQVNPQNMALFSMLGDRGRGILLIIRNLLGWLLLFMKQAAFWVLSVTGPRL
ncbi:MAG: hypothetical protein WBL95_01215 [Microcoleus sp.]